MTMDDTMRGQSFATAAVVRPDFLSPALGNATADPSHQHLDDAIRYLRYARDAAREGNRQHYLCRASEALARAGYPNLSALVDEAAERIGGDDTDMERLFADVLVLWREPTT